MNERDWVGSTRTELERPANLPADTDRWFGQLVQDSRQYQANGGRPPATTSTPKGPTMKARRITAADRKTDSSNGKKAKGSTQTRSDRRREHAALAQHHATLAAQYAAKAS